MPRKRPRLAYECRGDVIVRTEKGVTVKDGKYALLRSQVEHYVGRKFC